MKHFASLLSILCLIAGGWTPIAAQADTTEDPIIIPAPDTVINKQAYTLSEQGITIAVSYGSAYPAEHDYNNIDITYFACLAGGNMTISAETAIRGIAINGWVKKNFSASCDYGTIAYLSDDYDDTIGEPVLTISDVNNPSVTIQCDNQLRCFSLEVYFSSNPDDVQGEVADTVRFTAVTAEAADYSADTLYSSPGHYSYWLRLSPAETYPTVWLDLYAAEQGNLSGEYEWSNGNVGDYTYVQLSDNELDYEYAYDQQFTITRNDTVYHVEGWILCENEVQYEFTYTGPISLTPATPDEAGLSDTRTDTVATKRIDHGRLLIQCGERTYTVGGMVLDKQ